MTVERYAEHWAGHKYLGDGKKSADPSRITVFGVVGPFPLPLPFPLEWGISFGVVGLYYFLNAAF